MRRATAIVGGASALVAFIIATPVSAQESPLRAVYAAVLRYHHSNSAQRRVTVAESTAVYSVPLIGPPGRIPAPLERIQRQWARVPVELRDALAMQSGSSRLLGQDEIPLEAMLMPPESIDSLRGTWIAFRLGPVAFSARGDQALVYYQFGCGKRCGGDAVLWLTRAVDGAWAVEDRIGFIVF